MEGPIPALHSRDLLLILARLFDKTCFRCAWCGAIRRGMALHVFMGWTCSAPCTEQHLWSIQQLMRITASRSITSG